MKHSRTFIACLIGALGLTSSQLAFAQTPAYKIAFGQFWPVSFPKGEAKAGPTATTTGLAVNIRMQPMWVWYTEGGLLTPNTVFTPSPRVVFGPAYRLSDTVLLGLTGAYQFNPSHGNVDWSHTAGASLFLCVPISKEMSVTLAFGGGKNLREGGQWSLVAQPRAALTLPW